MNFRIEEVFLGIKPATRHGNMGKLLPVVKIFSSKSDFKGISQKAYVSV